jgi:hypothetical protein
MLESKIVVRTIIACSSICVGTILWFSKMENTTADGEPFSYPIWEHYNFVFFLIPSVSAVIFLLIGAKYKNLSWVFTVLCILWTMNVCRLFLINDGFKFIYWHQGEVFCPDCDYTYLGLWLASAIFGVFVSTDVLFRAKDRNKIRNAAQGTVGFVTLALMFFGGFLFLALWP